MTNMLEDGGYKYLQCVYCERRLSPPVGEHQAWTEPPEFVKGNCPTQDETFHLMNKNRAGRLLDGRLHDEYPI
jgi:hypothetical protein